MGARRVEVPSWRHAHDLGPTWMDLFDSFKGVRFGVIGVRLLKISLCSLMTSLLQKIVLI